MKLASNNPLQRESLSRRPSHNVNNEEADPGSSSCEWRKDQVVYGERFFLPAVRPTFIFVSSTTHTLSRYLVAMTHDYRIV